MYQQYLDAVKDKKVGRQDERDQRIKHEQVVNAYMTNEMSEIEKMEKSNAKNKY